MKGVPMRFFGREIEIAELKRIREISHETSQFTVVTGVVASVKRSLLKSR